MTPVQQQFSGYDYDLVPLTIPNAGTTSDAGDVSAGEIVGVELPTMTNGTLAFQVSTDGGTTWRDLYNSDGTTLTTFAASTGARICQAPAALKECGAPLVRVVAGAAQGAQRVLNLIVQRLTAE